jgi:hypothetical protein
MSNKNNESVSKLQQKSPIEYQEGLCLTTCDNNVNLQLGIDKLKFYYNGDYEFKSVQKWNKVFSIENPSQDKTQGVICRSQGNEILGSKLFINEKNYSATFKNNMMMVEWNPSKEFHESNLTSDPDLIEHTFNTITNDLIQNKDFDFNPNEMKLSRIDITKQSYMKQPTNVYMDIINGFRQSRRYQKGEYEGGTLIKNRQAELCIYDKGKHLQMLQGMKNIQPTNFLRIEARLMNSSKIKNTLPFNTIEGLLNNTHQLPDLYKKQLNTILPYKEIDFNNTEFSSQLELMKTCIESKKNNWFMFYLMSANSMQNLLTYKEMELMLFTVYNEGMLSRATVYRKLDEYRITIQELEFLKVRLKKNTANNNQNNYNEFVNTFYKFA